MNKLTKIATGLQKSILKESPTILAIMASTGVFTTAGLAIKGTPVAMYLIDEEEDRRYVANEPKMTSLEKVRLVWRCYAPAVAMGALTVACIFGSNSINLRRNALLAGAYQLSESRLKEYQKKVVDLLGPRKDEEIRDSINEDHVNRNPPKDKEVLIASGDGTVLFYDKYSGRYFKSDYESVRKAVNDFNSDMLTGMIWRTVNEFYDELDLPHIDAGNRMGWEAENGIMDVHYSSMIAPKGIPCIVIEFKTDPKML